MLSERGDLPKVRHDDMRIAKLSCLGVCLKFGIGRSLF